MDILSSLTYYSFSALVNLITSLLMAVIVFIKNSKTTANRTFVLFSLSVAGWSLFYFLWLIAPDRESQDFYLRTCMIGAMFVPAFFTHFVLLQLIRHCLLKKAGHICLLTTGSCRALSFICS
ncbi:MAG: hypothetical protein HY034_06510 [Nitrospirae bacterium]|nr:hypothetical protein [Nitrospirota bacterium]